jgi:hypothetical protein
MSGVNWKSGHKIAKRMRGCAVQPTAKSLISDNERNHGGVAEPMLPLCYSDAIEEEEERK